MPRDSPWQETLPGQSRPRPQRAFGHLSESLTGPWRCRRVAPGLPSASTRARNVGTAPRARRTEGGSVSCRPADCGWSLRTT